MKESYAASHGRSTVRFRNGCQKIVRLPMQVLCTLARLHVIKYDISENQDVCSAKMLYVHKSFMDKFLKQNIRARVEAVMALGLYL